MNSEMGPIVCGFPDGRLLVEVLRVTVFAAAGCLALDIWGFVWDIVMLKEQLLANDYVT